MKYLFLVPSIAFALPVLAEPTLPDVSCTFVLECFEGEACTETDYSITMENVDSTTSSWRLVTESETLKGTGIRLKGPSHMIFTGSTALHVVLIGAGKNARYTVHMQGPMAINYHGKCEALK